MPATYASPAVTTRAVATHAVLVLDGLLHAERTTAALLAQFPRARVSRVDSRAGLLDALDAGPWSLVVLAFDLPDYPGLAALADVRAATGAPVVALAAAPELPVVVAALRGGAADFVARTRWQDLGAAAVRLLQVPQAHAVAGDPGTGFARSLGWMAEHHAMVLFDARWAVTGCSRGVTAVLGHQPGALAGQPLDALFGGHPEQDAMLAQLRSWDGREPYGGSGWLLRADGLRMWAECTCVADRDAAGRVRQYCLTVRDGTLHYRATQAVRSQADAAAAGARARNLFLGSVAHELRAALAPIATSAILLERRGLDPQRQERLAGIVRRNTASAARLLDDLLTFSTAAQDKLQLRLDQVDVHRLLAESVDAMQEQAAAAGVDLALCADAAQAGVTCDRDRVRQVVFNLLGNAVKFTPPGGSVRVRTTGDHARFTIEVDDTGVGIDPAALPFIFDPFEQGGTGVTGRFGGFGLGLAICNAIARQHGGEVTASSQGQGRGATFRLHLPRHGPAPGRPAPAPRDTGVLHVLYVEDSPDAADAMRYALATLGWTMDHAASCAQARERVAAPDAGYDVVLADLGLPDGSGLELGSELSHRLPVVALTAYGAPLAMAGFANQLIKPAEIGDVQRALLQAVASRRASGVA